MRYEQARLIIYFLFWRHQSTFLISYLFSFLPLSFLHSPGLQIPSLAILTAWGVGNVNDAIFIFFPARNTSTAIKDHDDGDEASHFHLSLTLIFSLSPSVSNYSSFHDVILEFFVLFDSNIFSLFISVLLLRWWPLPAVTQDRRWQWVGWLTPDLQCEENDNSSLQWSNTAQQTLYFGEKRGKLHLFQRKIVILCH